MSRPRVFDRILVALDGSDDSRAASELAIRLADLLGSALRGLSVIDVRIVEGPAVETLAPLWGEVTGRPFQPEVMRLYRERAESAVEDFCSRAEERSGAPAERGVEIGIAEDVIVERAAEADLLVMGRRGEHAGFGRQPLGATAWRVLRRSPCAVLVAGQASATDPAEASRPAVPRRSLVAWDPGSGGRKALNLAIGYATRVQGELKLVHAGPEKSDADLEEARELLAASGLSWESARLDDTPAAAVQRALRTWDADCLFMGAFGRGRVRDFLFGSHTAEILERAPVPVFVAR